MASDDNTVTNLQGHIRDLEQEIIDTKRMVNRLLVRKGQQPLYPDAAIDGEAGTVFGIRSDQFYGESLSGAMRQYLKMRRAANLGPATVHEMYEALVRGGFAFGTDNEENRKRIIRLSLVKSSSLFHRLPDGTHYGLPDWYGDIAKKEQEAVAAKEKKPKRVKLSKKVGKSERGRVKERVAEAASDRDAGPNEQPAPAEEPLRSPPSVINAVQEAVLSMNGEFTKQDVVNWVEQHYPPLNAQQRKTSIFSMMANLKGKLRLVTVRAGKGKEPHTYRRAEIEEKEGVAVK